MPAASQDRNADPGAQGGASTEMRSGIDNPRTFSEAQIDRQMTVISLDSA